MLHNFIKFFNRKSRNFQLLVFHIYDFLYQVNSILLTHWNFSVLESYIIWLQVFYMMDRAVRLQHDGPQVVASDRSDIRFNHLQQTSKSHFLTLSHHAHKVQKSPGHESLDMSSVTYWLNQLAMGLSWKIKHSSIRNIF